MARRSAWSAYVWMVRGEMDGQVSWGLLWSGLGALAIVAIIGALLAGSNNGVWLEALLPLAMVLGGAVVLAGREG